MVKRIDTSSSLRLAILQEMLEEISRAGGPEEAIGAYAQRIRKLRDFDAYLGVQVVGLPTGSFRITRRYRSERFAGSGKLEPSSPRELVGPPLAGGFLGNVIARPEPQLFQELSIEADPVCGGVASGMGSCMAVPLFERGQISAWSVLFRSQAHGYRIEDLEDDLLVGNLFNSIQSNLASLGRIGELNQRLRAQFEEVARVQQALLPERPPTLPGVSFATSYLTSDQAGGDYFDFFDLPDGRVGIFVADVSGHGAGAATVMAMLHGVLHSSPFSAANPRQALEFVNRRLCAARTDGSYTTALLACYDPRSRELVTVSAGHPPPVRFRPGIGGDVGRLPVEAAAPLGIVDSHHLPQTTHVLMPGDSLVMYTDGVTEAFNPGREMFGEVGLCNALRDCSGHPDDCIDAIHRALFKHTGTLARSDDQTIVALRIDP